MLAPGFSFFKCNIQTMQQQQDTSLRDVKRELQATAEEQLKLALQRHGAMQSLTAGTVL